MIFALLIPNSKLCCHSSIAILKDISGEYVEEGNLTEWEKYRETYLRPVTTRFAVSKLA